MAKTIHSNAVKVYGLMDKAKKAKARWIEKQEAAEQARIQARVAYSDLFALEKEGEKLLTMEFVWETMFSGQDLNKMLGDRLVHRVELAYKVQSEFFFTMSADELGRLYNLLCGMQCGECGGWHCSCPI